MKCEKCGTEYEGNFCPNGCNSPAVQTKPKKPIYKKWWFWVLIVLAVAIIGSSASGGDSDTTEGGGTSSQTTTVTSSQTEEAKDDNVYNVGDVIKADGLEITYVSAEKWTGYSQYMAPDDGYMYIRIKLAAYNSANSDRYFSMYEFDGYADGAKIDMAYLFDDTLSGGNISAGRKTEGYLYFSVPTGAKNIEIEYETSFWTDKKAILKVVV